MSKQILNESIQTINAEMQNAENEVKAVNAAAEYFTSTDLEGAERLDNKEIAEELNKEFNTDLTKEDINKIDKIVQAEMDSDIESVGWDKSDNNVDMNKINEIYENNKEVFEKNEVKEEKIENDKESLLDKAKDKLQEAFENLQEAAENVDIHAALRNSDNVFDRAQAEFFDQVDEFTQNLHNQSKEKEENNYVINEETREKLNELAHPKEQENNQENNNETEKTEKENNKEETAENNQNQEAKGEKEVAKEQEAAAEASM